MSFNGSQSVCFRLDNGSLSEVEDVSLRFRTGVAAGTLLVISSAAPSGDVFKLSLNRGRVSLRIYNGNEVKVRDYLLISTFYKQNRSISGFISLSFLTNALIA